MVWRSWLGIRSRNYLVFLYRQYWHDYSQMVAVV